ncbi:hypothetical protein D3C87_1809650 [compost metagenome]
MQDVGRSLHRAFSGLSDGDTVVHVFYRLAQAVDLAGQTVSDLQTGSVVFSAVDTQAGRQALHGSGQGAAGFVQVNLSSDRRNVGVYG